MGSAAALVRVPYEGDFREQSSKIPSTPIPNDVLEAVMHDRLASFGGRIQAWIYRNSWGRQSWHAVNEKGEFLHQADCARELGIDKRRVSKVVKYLIHRGYLLNEIKILYPLTVPNRDVQEGDCKKVAPSGDFYKRFVEDEWRVAHSTEFEELQVARGTVSRITKMILVDYKKSRVVKKSPPTATFSGEPLLSKKSPTSATSAGPEKSPTSATSAEKSQTPPAAKSRIKSVGTYLPTSGDSRYVGRATEHTPATGPTDLPTPRTDPEPAPKQPALPEEKHNSVEKGILRLPTVRQLMKRLQNLPAPKLLAEIVQNLQGAPLEQFERRIQEKFNKVKSFGLLKGLALDVGNAYRLELDEEKQKPPEPAPPVEPTCKLCGDSGYLGSTGADLRRCECQNKP